MIDSDMVLSSKNRQIAVNSNEKHSYTSNPDMLMLKYKLQARIKQSHTNLFNFINDTY